MSTVDGFAHSDLSQERGERRSGVDRAVDRPKDLAVTLLSLKRSSAESAFSLNRWKPSKGMSIKLAWTSPEKPAEKMQAW